MTTPPPTLSRDSDTALTHTRTRVSTTRSSTLLAVRGLGAGRRLLESITARMRAVGSLVRPGGWVALAAATLGLTAGVLFGIGELIAAGVAAAALLLLAAPFLLRLRPYAVTFTLEHDRVVAGGAARARIDIRNDSAALVLPGTVDIPIGAGIVDIAVPLLRRGGHFEDDVVIPAPRRGVIPIGPIRSVRSDPLGMMRREATWSEIRTLYVHPRTTAIPPTTAGFIRDLEGRPSPVLVDADISFHAIREYVPGDDRRHVHWKSTAKTGTLMVRQYEQTRRSRMVIAVDTAAAAYRDDDEFELAVSAAASLGLRGVRDGRDVHVVVGEPIPEFATRRVRAIRELPTLSERVLLDGLSGISSHEAVNPLAEVAALAVDAHSDVSLAFLVCGSTTTAAQLQHAALAFPVHVGVAAVVCDLEAEPRVRQLGDVAVIRIGLLDDLRHLLLRGSQT